MKFYGVWILALTLASCATGSGHSGDNHVDGADTARGVQQSATEAGNINAVGGNDLSGSGTNGGTGIPLGTGARADDNLDGIIKGYCEIAGDENTRSPCSDVPVEIRTLKGKTIGQTRTDTAGNFLFHVKGKSQYEISPSGSAYIAEFRPRMPVSAGAEIRMRLKVK